MKVVVSSFHSCSAYALQSTSIVFDALVSFDSHLDTHLLGYREGVVNAIGNNLPLFFAAGRSSTHVSFLLSAFRRVILLTGSSKEMS
jgi:hypothetical protein